MAVQVIEVVCVLAPMWGEVSDGKHLERLSSGLLSLSNSTELPQASLRYNSEDLHSTRD